MRAADKACRSRTPLAARAVALLSLAAACATADRRFPLRAPLWVDTDRAPVTVKCRRRPTERDPGHVSCAPAVSDAPLIWDGMDNTAFRPLSETLRLPRAHEAIDVNSLDEVPDSAWFTNRIGARPMTADEIRRGACRPELVLDPAAFTDGSWVIDAGKTGGATPGFRVSVPEHGKYLFKGGSAADHAATERGIAASIIGLAVYHAVGFNTSCDQAVRFKPSLLSLKPGLRYKLRLDVPHALDRRALDGILRDCAAGGGTVRMVASAWIPGYIIGPSGFEGTRTDDPNDVVPHEDRRELRASRLVAAWLNRVDARDGNTLDAWLAADRDGPADGSPGHVEHYQIDTSEALGSEWTGDEIARRLGHAYVVDLRELVADFFTLGARVRPWDTARLVPGREMFGYYDVEHFVPERWKSQYPNPAFARMTERDGAWMARILARFTPETIRELVAAGQLSDPADAEYLASVLEGRLQRILARYLTRLSPIADLRVEAGDRLCGVDLAARRGVRPPGEFRYAARLSTGGALPVAVGEGGAICVSLPRVADDGGPADDAGERYVRVIVADGVARGALTAHLYDLGPTRGFVLVGLER